MPSQQIQFRENHCLTPVGNTQIHFCGLVVLDWWELYNTVSPLWRWYCNEGEGASITVAGRRIELCPHTVYLIPPNVEFATHTTPGVRHTYLHFSLDSVFRLQEGLIPKHRPAPFEREAIIRLRGELETAGGGSPFMVSFFSQTVVNLALAALPREAWKKVCIPWPVERVLQRMREAYPAALSNAALAKTSGLHRNAFMKAFRDFTGYSPRQYLLRLRLEEAVHLLWYTTCSIDEIAGKTGFYDRFHFSRAFKTHYRCTPARYRGQNPVPSSGGMVIESRTGDA